MPRWIKESAAALLATGAVLFAIYRLTPVVEAQGHGGQVWGPVAAGTAASTLPFGNPVLVGGTDGTNVRAMSTDTAGRPINAAFGSSTGLIDANSNSVTLANASNGNAIFNLTLPLIFNGTTWDRGRSASLSNFPTSQTLTARNSIGAILSEKGGRWTVISNPAAGSQASASIAAELAVRHVCDCVAFSAESTTAPVLTSIAVSLHDGTGAGTIVWAYGIAISASTGQNVAPHSICGLNIVGTTNTAMTFQFDAALANLIETVSVSGYNVN